MTRLILILCLCILCLPFSARAELYENAHRANPQYEFMARRAFQVYPKEFDFMEFRAVYSETRQYDPIGEDTLARMDTLSYTVMTEKNTEKSGMALLEYRALVADHLAHLGVVMKALTLARQDKRFGNPDFFRWVKAGIMDTVMISGTGKSLREAYDVVTLPEETALLYTLNVKLLKADPRNEGMIWYNMDDVEDLRTKEHWTVFVNTTYPMRFLEEQQQARSGPKLNIPRQ